MNDRVVKFRVGVMVIASAILAGILILTFGDVPEVSWNYYYVNIHFEDAPGITEGTPVRKSGITIGRVTKVELVPQGGVDVRVKIQGNIRLHKNEVPEVSGSLLGGDVVIQFVKQKRPPNKAGAAERPEGMQVAFQKDDEFIQPDDRIPGIVAPNPLQSFGNLEEDIAVAVKHLGSAGEEVGKLANRFNRLMEDNDDQISRIVDKAEKTLDALQRSLVGVEDVFGDVAVRNNLKKTMQDLPELLSDARGALKSVSDTVSSMEKNMRNLEGLTGPLGDRGGVIVDNVDSAVERLDDLLANLTTFSRDLTSGQGSLGRLMKDQDLYQHLNRAAINLDQITRDVRPILSDVRVFTDKIARQPSILGVRGALQKEAPIK